MGELISRQAAIDAIQQHRENVLGSYEYDEDVAFVYAAAHNHIIDVIERLPSVQPEIIRCKDCKYAEYNYINEHFGDLQDTAYKKGLHDGESKCGYCNDYQRGLDDAWEAARKIAQQWEEDTDTEHRLVIDDSIRVTLDSMTASEAIAKLKAYEEQKADNEIKVGDEVEWDNDFTGDRFIVTRIYQPYGKKEQCDGIDDDGDVYRAVLIESLVKTGRHFDIEKILEDMRND